MRELQMDQHAMVLQATDIFQPKIKAWKKEIQYWKQEVASLRSMLAIGAFNCSSQEKKHLKGIDASLLTFEMELLPVTESEIESLDFMLQGKPMRLGFKHFEEKMESLRATYQETKTKLFPYFAKFVTLNIW